MLSNIKNFIFGAGHFSLPMKWYLESQGIKFQGVVLTQKDKSYFDGTPVYDLSEMPYIPQMCRIYYAVSEKYHSEIDKILKEYGYNDVVKYKDEELNVHYNKANNLKHLLVEKYGGYLPQKTNVIESWDRICIIRLDGIGDMVMSTPFFRELRRNNPRSKITLLVNVMSYSLFEKCPYVDRVIAVDWEKEICNSTFIMGQLKNAKKFVERNLKGENFDVTIVPRYDCDYYGASYLALFSGAPAKIAFSEHVRRDKELVNKDYDLIFSHTVMSNGVFHEVERGLQLLTALGMENQERNMELWIDDDDVIAVENILASYKVKDKSIIAIGLSASHESKTWPDGKYASLINKINDVSGGHYVFVLLGGDKERTKPTYIENNIINTDCVINLCGRIGLREVYALLKHSMMYIGHDTGVMHIAAVAQIPVIEICATPPVIPKNHTSSTARFGPWQTECEIIRPKEGYWDDGWKNADGGFAIRDITVDEVFEAVKKYI